MISAGQHAAVLVASSAVAAVVGAQSWARIDRAVARARLPRRRAGAPPWIGWTRHLRRWWPRRHDGAAVQHELALLIDLLTVAAAAGCPPYAAVEVATRWGPPRLSASLAAAVHTTRVGERFVDGLRAAGRAETVLQPLTEALVASATLGAPIQRALDRLAAHARDRGRRDAQIRARRIPVLLLFPLVFLVLPAFGLLTVAPALLSALAQL